MTVQELALELWPLVAFIVTIVVTLLLSNRKNLEKRMLFLEELISKQTATAEQNQDRLLTLFADAWKEKTGRPLEGDSKVAMEVAAESTSTIGMGDLLREWDKNRPK